MTSTIDPALDSRPGPGIIWSRLVPGMVLAGFLALSVHVVMLDVLHVPFPSLFPQTGIAAYLNNAGRVLALIIFYDLAAARFVRWPIAGRCLALFLLDVMLHEWFRSAVMGGVLTTAWVYSFVSALPKLAPILLVACLIVLTASQFGSWWRKLAAALAFTALAFFVCRPLAQAGFQPVLEAISRLSHDQVLSETSWGALVAAYLSFIEPVMAVFVMVAFIWDRLSTRPGLRAAQFTLLLLMLKGVLFAPFIYILYAGTGVFSALVSYGQFTLEFTALGLLAVAVWGFSQRARRSQR